MRAFSCGDKSAQPWQGLAPGSSFMVLEPKTDPIARGPKGAAVDVSLPPPSSISLTRSHHRPPTSSLAKPATSERPFLTCCTSRLLLEPPIDIDRLTYPTRTEIAVRIGGTRAPAGHSADYYRKHRKQLVENGPVKKQHADLTKGNIYGIMKK